ncbi:MAG: hypothetical protein EXS13_10045 [Planctomycetes bacterium]|nr:hypothetical protein [Planctomycetota bacterium]
MKRLLSAMLAVAAVAAPIDASLRAQERGSGDTIAPIGYTAPIASNDVTIAVYSPKLLTAGELFGIANQLFGEQLDVQLLIDGELSNSFQVQHFMLFGQGLMVRDSRANCAAIMKQLGQLEQSTIDREVAEQADAQERAEAERAANAALKLEYTRTVANQRSSLLRAEIRPRFVSLATLRDVLTPFERFINQDSAREGDLLLSNITIVEQANVILVHDDSDRIDEMTSLAALVDRARPQLNVSAVVLQVGGDATSAGVSGDLVGALGRLGMGTSFKLLSTGALRCAVQSKLFCQLGTEAIDGSHWNLTFLPEACDAESGCVSLSQCKFSTQLAGTPTSGGNKPGATQTFETSVTLALGEWVVLGAIGAQPTLIALRVDVVPPQKFN